MFALEYPIDGRNLLLTQGFHFWVDLIRTIFLLTDPLIYPHISRRIQLPYLLIQRNPSHLGKRTKIVSEEFNVVLLFYKFRFVYYQAAVHNSDVLCDNPG